MTRKKGYLKKQQPGVFNKVQRKKGRKKKERGHINQSICGPFLGPGLKINKNQVCEKSMKTFMRQMET